MNTTLPDLETLQTMDDLSALTLFRVEVRHLDQVEGVERLPVYERARQGDPEARAILLGHCQVYLLAKAHQIYDERRPGHIDVLDLVGEANVFMMEHLDIALTKREAISYLMAMTMKHMEHYCTYNASMIQRPFGINMEVLARRQQYTSVESLDAPLYTEDDTVLLIERIQAPAPVPERTAEEFNARFSPLYEAIERLSPAARTAIVQFYGLFDQPALTAMELGQEQQVRYETINASKRQGYRKLKALLANDLEKLLHWQQPGEEE